jgi:uncharacterized cupredoxin-like copper-binding protein
MTRKFLKSAFVISLFAALATVGALVVSSSAWAASTVNVEMWDHSPSDMGFTLDKTTVPAGKVTFKATNTSSKNEHEMVVIKVDSKLPNLPYNTRTKRVPEGRIKSLGEISEVKPGGKGELTLNMKPGIYLLFCNVRGHFAAHMKTLFFVK